MSAANLRRGFILPVTVFLLSLATVVVTTTAYFVTNAARQSRIHLARTRCRLAAQAAIEQAKNEIQERFSTYVSKQGVAVKLNNKSAEVYNWFDEISSDHRTIGKTYKECAPLTLVDPPNGINGCTINVGIGKYIVHEANSSLAIIPLVATATYMVDKLPVRITIQERVVFGTGQSKVFDYAYFVNNYGWMNGSNKNIIINGDMRANGNVSLSDAIVNGFIYAAANDELDVAGTVKLSSSPQIWNQSRYRSSSGSRARPDKNDYNVTSSYDAPSTTGTIVAPSYTTSYDSNGNTIYTVVLNSNTTVAEESGNPIVNAYSDSLPMPFISELDAYVDYAKEYQNEKTGSTGGRLSYPSTSYTDAAGEEKVIPGGDVLAHYTGAGPSGDVNGADKGTLVLIGTKANPIEIDGPVVVDSDVIIRGYVKGQGTIYSGRNIHIIGDVLYVNSPTWSHPDSNASTHEEENNSKDMLGLVAKGNIILGDSTQANSTWHSSVDSYINSSSRSSVVHSYACDESDANIGYPSTFAGNYTAEEKVENLSATLAANAPGGYDSATGKFGKIRSTTVEKDTGHYETYNTWWGEQKKWVADTEVQNIVSYDRRYYETICDDKVITSLKDANGIVQVDAVLYNNHGIFGTPGRRNATFNLNGSLVCRDEGLIFTGNGITFNWDFRLRRKGSSSATNVSLPLGPAEPYTLEWMQIPESLNPVFKDPTKGGSNS